MDAGTRSNQKNKIFVSYSHRDRRWLIQLKPHLVAIQSLYNISVWDDTLIELGEKWNDIISSEISESEMALLLISPDFLASQFIVEDELPRLLRHFHGKQGCVVSVFIRHSVVASVVISYTTSDNVATQIRLTDLQGFIAPNKPLSKLSLADRDEAFVQLVNLLIPHAKPSPSAAADTQERRRIADEDTTKGRASRITLVFNDEFQNWSMEREEKILRRIARALEIEPTDIKVQSRRSGSTLLEVLMPPEAAFDLAELSDLGAFADIKLAGVYHARAIESDKIDADSNDAMREKIDYTLKSTAEFIDDEKLFALAAIDTFGMLDSNQEEAFRRTFEQSSEAVKNKISRQRDLLIQTCAYPIKTLTRHLEYQHIAMTRSAVSGHQTDEHILSVARRRVPSRWRAIALGSVAAAFIFAVAFFNAISTFKNISGSQLDALAGREELIVAMNSIVIQLAPASPEVKIQGRLFQQDRRAVLMVFVPPAEVTKKFDVFLVDARGNQIKLSSLVFAENVSIRVVDISSNYLDEIAVGRLEIRDTEGRVFLHT